MDFDLERLVLDVAGVQNATAGCGEPLEEGMSFAREHLRCVPVTQLQIVCVVLLIPAYSIVVLKNPSNCLALKSCLKSSCQVPMQVLSGVATALNCRRRFGFRRLQEPGSPTAVEMQAQGKSTSKAGVSKIVQRKSVVPTEHAGDATAGAGAVEDVEAPARVAPDRDQLPISEHAEVV